MSILIFVGKMKELLETYQVDALLLASRENKYYTASLYSGSGYVLVMRDEVCVFVDARYYVQMKAKNQQDKIYLLDGTHTFMEYMKHFVVEKNIKRIAFEKEQVSYAMYETLKEIEIVWVACDLDVMRRIKSEDEIALIQKACDIASCAYAHILRFIKVGMSEKEVANELVYTMCKLGADKESFDTIVVSGSRGVLPHAKASDHVIGKDDFVTIDFGARYKEYCSDITRTFAMSNTYNPKLREIYEVVLEAQRRAIQAIQIGKKCSDIDDMARAYIAMRGYGEYFTHNLGHSMGIVCHESPNFAPNDDTILQSGMVLTVEPGIYIEGLGGVRIEDDILVSETGAIVLTKAKKAFYVIGDDQSEG